jgi:hypothetical protein
LKKILLITFIFIGTLISAQELPSPFAKGYAFPLGSKFTIKLSPIDSVSFNYSIISIERFAQTIHSYKHDDLFEKTGNDSTITFYFCLGTHGDSADEKKKNMQVLLLMKNYTKLALDYSSDIQQKEDGKYEPTSNVGTFPGVMGMEMWPYMIYSIGLRDFKKHQ